MIKFKLKDEPPATPMGFTLIPAYDSAARLQNLTSSWNDAQHPATLLSVNYGGTIPGYSPAGEFSNLNYGNGLTELNTYNSRLQPTNMRTYNPANGNVDVLNLSFGFTDSSGHNNGDLQSFSSIATQIFIRSYGYDSLNRLATMSSPADASGCYGLTWTYDPWGNRLAQTTTPVTGGACFSLTCSPKSAEKCI